MTNIQDSFKKFLKLLVKEGLVNNKKLRDKHHDIYEYYDRLRALMSLCVSLCPELSFVALKDNPEEFKEEFNGDFVVGVLTPLGPAPIYCKLHYWKEFRFLTPDEYAPLISNNNKLSAQDRCIRFQSLTKMLIKSPKSDVVKAIEQSKTLKESQKPSALHKGIKEAPVIVPPSEDSDDVKAVTEAVNVITKILIKRNLIQYKKIQFGWNTSQDLLDLELELVCLFAALCPELSFASWKHYDGTMHEDDFVAGIYTPEGPISFHFNEQYADRFSHDVWIDRGPMYDGYKHRDAINRIDSLTSWFASNKTSIEIIDFIYGNRRLDESHRPMKPDQLVFK